MDAGLEDFKAVFALALKNNPNAFCLCYSGDDPTVFTIFDYWGPRSHVDRRAKELNRVNHNPTGLDVLFHGGPGDFGCVSLEYALKLLNDPDERLDKYESLHSDGSCVSRFGCPRSAWSAVRHPEDPALR